MEAGTVSAEAAPRAEESMHEEIINLCDIGLLVVDCDLGILRWNRWMELHSRISRAQAIGRRLEDLFPVLTGSTVLRAVGNSLRTGSTSVISCSLNRHHLPLHNGHGMLISQHTVIKSVESPSRGRCCLLQISDVSTAVTREMKLKEQTQTLKQLAETISEEKERAQVTLQSIADAVITTDSRGEVLSMNKVAEELTGWTSEQSRGKSASKIFSVIQETSRKQAPNPVVLCLESRFVVSNDKDLLLLDKYGGERAITHSAAPILDDQHELIGSVLVFRDVTDSRNLAAQLKWQAQHDPLTGLANRREFEARLASLFEQAKASAEVTHALLYIDLDQFKVVNDSCGHTAGDQLLREIGGVLKEKLRASDMLARLGGDEFCVLLERCPRQKALAIANTLRDQVQHFRFAWDGKNFRLGLSIGLVEITGVEKDPAEILSAADTACYVAKDTGRNRVHVHEFDQRYISAQQREIKWISRIQSALDEDRFVLYAQRIASVSGQQPTESHYEVLIRMLDEEGSLVPPGAFIPAAERFNLMPTIDLWVIRNLLARLADRYSDARNLPMFSINLSGASLSDQNLLQTIKNLLVDSGLPIERIGFEITETAAIANLSQVVHFISELKTMGCRFSLDDFGSGLSSFAYLKTLPVDSLKIDGHFVKDIAHDPINRAFVDSINQIGHVMGLTTIAEFVEDDLILETLEEIGVDFAQGYGIDKPVELDQVLLAETCGNPD